MWPLAWGDQAVLCYSPGVQGSQVSVGNSAAAMSKMIVVAPLVLVVTNPCRPGQLAFTATSLLFWSSHSLPSICEITVTGNFSFLGIGRHGSHLTFKQHTQCAKGEASVWNRSCSLEMAFQQLWDVCALSQPEMHSHVPEHLPKFIASYLETL